MFFWNNVCTMPADNETLLVKEKIQQLMPTKNVYLLTAFILLKCFAHGMHVVNHHGCMSIYPKLHVRVGLTITSLPSAPPRLVTSGAFLLSFAFV